MKGRALALVVAIGLLWGPAPAATQETTPSLEAFVQQVARLWAAGDAGGLVELMPSDNRLLLDTGTGTEAANSRHASAALRALFSERETTAVRAVRVTVASSRPPQGFGEIAWTFRARGSPGDQTRNVYVAALWEAPAWRISELRVMR
jgi:hypothetical protein